MWNLAVFVACHCPARRKIISYLIDSPVGTRSKNPQGADKTLSEKTKPKTCSKRASPSPKKKMSRLERRKKKTKAFR